MAFVAMLYTLAVLELIVAFAMALGCVMHAKASRERGFLTYGLVLLTTLMPCLALAGMLLNGQSLAWCLALPLLICGMSFFWSRAMDEMDRVGQKAFRERRLPKGLRWLDV